MQSDISRHLPNALLAGSPQAVEAMTARVCGGESGKRPYRSVEACGGRWCLGAPEPDRLAAGRRYHVALLGTPYWNDESLDNRCRTAGPAAAFLAALEQFGEDALAQTHGPFAVAWTDEETGELSLAIDRAGMQELYWRGLDDGSIAAASRCDLASLAAVDSPRLDPVSLYNYLFYYCVPGPRTIFRDIRRLLPAQRLKIGAGAPVSTTYWRMPYGQAEMRDPEAWHAAVRETLSQAVARVRRSPDAEAGAFLSGGLDSSSIVGFLAEHSPNPKTFTIRFHDAAYDEGQYARLAATHFETEHHERYVLPEEVAPAMDGLSRLYDQPFGNSSAIAAYYCALSGRNAGVKTMIAGDGGDELFAGNARYLELRRYDVYGRIPALLRRFVFDPLLSPDLLNAIPVLGKAHRLRKRYAMSLPHRMFVAHHSFEAFRLDEVVAGELLAEMRGHDPIGLADSVCDSVEGGDDLQRMMAVDLKLTIADNDLIKVNRACALAGVEARYPMLDTEVMELAARIPSSQMLAGGRLRGLFKEAMREFLPSEILSKPKHGFGLPFKNWVGEHADLREKILDALSDLRRRKLFTENYLDALQQACLEDEAGKLRGNAWDMAMLELWLQSHEHSL